MRTKLSLALSAVLAAFLFAGAASAAPGTGDDDPFLGLPADPELVNPTPIQHLQSVLGRGTTYRQPFDWIPNGSWRRLNLRPRTAATQPMATQAPRSAATVRIAR